MNNPPTEFLLTITALDVEAKTQTLILTDTVLSLGDEALGRFVQVMVETIKSPRSTKDETA